MEVNGVFQDMGGGHPNMDAIVPAPTIQEDPNQTNKRKSEDDINTLANQAQRPREDYDDIEIEEDSAPGSGGQIPGNQVSDNLHIPAQHQQNNVQHLPNYNQNTDEGDEVSQHLLVIELVDRSVNENLIKDSATLLNIIKSSPIGAKSSGKPRILTTSQKVVLHITNKHDITDLLTIDNIPS